MDPLSDKDLHKIQQALSTAFRKRDESVIGDTWEKGVLARIQKLNTPVRPLDFMALLERYFWRFAPVSAVALLVLSFILYQQMTSFSEYETARALVGNTWAGSLYQMLGAS
jgi:hypothetical protein